MARDPEVVAFLAGLSSDVKDLVLALRDTILRVSPNVEESIVWGGLSYHRPQIGGRVKGAVCQIGVKGGQVRLDFIHGIRLPDPHELLEGNRISKRFISIDTIADAKRPEVKGLIREAAALKWD
jgi:hypothetical protein